MGEVEKGRGEGASEKGRRTEGGRKSGVGGGREEDAQVCRLMTRTRHLLALRRIAAANWVHRLVLQLLPAWLS